MATEACRCKPYVYCHFPFTESLDYGIPQSHIKQLEENFEIAWHRDVVTDESLARKVRAAVLFGPCSKSFFDNLHTMPSLEVIANHGVGVDHIMAHAEVLRLRSIKVSNTPDILSDSTADMGLALMLASARQLIKGVQIAMYSPVATAASMDFGVDVSGATLGIIGMGRIGFKVAERAKAFGMKILYFNRHQRPKAEEGSVNGVYCSDLRSLLSSADFIMITCPSTPDTVGLIGKAEFDVMKETATIVNIARGDIIDTAALVEALSHGRIRGAALDVTNPEPLPVDHELRLLPNVIVVPHWGSCTVATRQRMMQLCIDNILAALRGERLLTEHGWATCCLSLVHTTTSPYAAHMVVLPDTSLNDSR